MCWTATWCLHFAEVVKSASTKKTHKTKPTPLNPLFFTVVSVSHSWEGWYLVRGDTEEGGTRIYTNRQSESHTHLPAAEVRFNIVYMLPAFLETSSSQINTAQSSLTGRGHCVDSSRCKGLLKPVWRKCWKAYTASGLSWKSCTWGSRSPKREAEATETWPWPRQTQR